MSLTPLDIQQHQFRVRFRGFDIQEVDEFLERLARQVDDLQGRNEALQAEVTRVTAANRGLRDREESFKRAMLNTQQVVEQMKHNAQKSAELVMADAEVKAEKMLNRAHNRLSQLHEDIAELKRQRVQIESQLRAVIETHSRLLDIGKEEVRAMNEEDAKLTILKKS